MCTWVKSLVTPCPCCRYSNYGSIYKARVCTWVKSLVTPCPWCRYSNYGSIYKARVCTWVKSLVTPCPWCRYSNYGSIYKARVCTWVKSLVTPCPWCRYSNYGSIYKARVCTWVKSLVTPVPDAGTVTTVVFTKPVCAPGWRVWLPRPWCRYSNYGSIYKACVCTWVKSLVTPVPDAGTVTTVVFTKPVCAPGWRVWLPPSLMQVQ